MKMQELVKFNYCPRCGSQDLQPKESKAVLCTSCGFQYFHNTAPAVAGIIEQAGSLILIRRARQPQKGLLAFPGGFVDYEESLEEALMREIQEELNLRVTSLTYLISDWDIYAYQDVIYPTTAAYFVANVADIKQAKAGDDAEGFSFVPLDVIDPDRLAFKSSRTALQKFQEWRKDGKF